MVTTITKTIGKVGGTDANRSRHVKPPTGGPKFGMTNAIPTISAA